jgi:hypothetical protein
MAGLTRMRPAAGAISPCSAAALHPEVRLENAIAMFETPDAYLSVSHDRHVGRAASAPFERPAGQHQAQHQGHKCGGKS